MVDVLLANGININTITPFNKSTALFWAAMQGNTQMVSHLIKKGANINQPNKYDLTPLSAARTNNYDEVVKILLENAASDTQPE